MKSELVAYNSLVKAIKPLPLRVDAKGKDTFTLLGFWRANEDKVPAFSDVVLAVVTASSNVSSDEMEQPKGSLSLSSAESPLYPS